jgi:hypothetical protein
MSIREFALAAGLLLVVLSPGSAVAAPVASAGGVEAGSGVEQAQWHGSRRCWWETRRFRDHRGRWHTRRVQVCPR